MKTLMFAVALLSGAAWGQSATNGWMQSTSEVGDPFTVNVNEAGEGLTLVCFSSENVCRWHIVVDTSCEPGVISPAMISGSSATSQHKLTCEGAITVAKKQKYRLAMDQHESMNTHAEAGGMLGIVFPLEGGRFRVLRFSMDGAVSAMKEVATRSIRATKDRKRASEIL